MKKLILLFFVFTLKLVAQDVCLVTGGAGFIGAHVTNDLIKKGHKVVVLDDLSGGFEENVNPEAIFVKGSIVDHKLVEQLFSQYQFDYVYHLAAYAAEGLSHFIRRFNYMNNLIGSVNLINEAVKNNVKCFVFTSSMAVYGTGQPPFLEDTVPCPEDSYGIAKFAVEQDLKAAHEVFGLNYIIFRPHNVYGEYQNIGDKYRNVVGIFINQLMCGKPVTVFGDGTQIRAFSYIGDIAPYIAKSVHTPAAYNQIINIGGEQPITINQLATEVMAAMGIEGEILHLPPRIEVKVAYSDHAKARAIFGTYNPTPLSEGLVKMAAWAKQVGAKKSKNFDNIEIMKNIPQKWVQEN